MKGLEKLKSGSLGKLELEYEAKTIDQNRNDLPEGAVGELCVKDQSAGLFHRNE